MSEQRRALITGITGQDGTYLSEYLLGRGYTVAGIVHEHEPTDAIPSGVDVLRGDLRDAASLRDAVSSGAPDEVYNLAALSFVGASFDEPEATCDVTGMGVLRLLEAIRAVNPAIHFFQASSAEIFAAAPISPQDESTPLSPRSPYGVAKAFAHQMVVTYRETHGMFACNGILFNHESPRRGVQFVTRKITDAAARIKLGVAETVTLGNLHVSRDWGFAGDYVTAMPLMLGHEAPDDYVIATGVLHTLQEFLDAAFFHVGLHWQDHVTSDPALFRPNEPVQLRGNASRARDRLGWTATTPFVQLVAMMVDADLERVAAEVATAS